MFQGVSWYNFRKNWGDAVRPTVSGKYDLTISCRCYQNDPLPGQVVRVGKSSSGYIEFTYPTLFACPHTVSFERIGVAAR